MNKTQLNKLIESSIEDFPDSKVYFELANKETGTTIWSPELASKKTNFYTDTPSGGFAMNTEVDDDNIILWDNQDGIYLLNEPDELSEYPEARKILDLDLPVKEKLDKIVNILVNKYKWVYIKTVDE